MSYAQNREDLFLWALIAQRTPGFYVDVGCNHERLHSVTRLFYEHGWSGVNIDANPKMAPRVRSSAPRRVRRRRLDLDRYRPTVVVVEASRADQCAEVLVPRRYRLEFLDGLNVYYVDDDAADVSIHNYAGRVLHCGFRTDAELQLIDRLNRADDRLSDSARSGGAMRRLRPVVARWNTRWDDSVRPRLVRCRVEWSARRHRRRTT